MWFDVVCSTYNWSCDGRNAQIFASQSINPPYYVFVTDCIDLRWCNNALTTKAVNRYSRFTSIPIQIKSLTLTLNSSNFITEKYNREISPEEIFYYIYAVLYSPTYRKKYEEFLQHDFPRIPFVGDYEKFKKLSDLGKELVELHLMKKRLPIKVKFDIQGSNVVEKAKYKDGKVWINKEQYFEQEK